ncbi:Uncharacterised protein [Raoultella terrigena]|uniref:Uncharacterized protein n=1 Tax=Raoultella terrigena TaxID=577 RepID=A0A3P8KKM3_RAOTE|nr:Uncharacterised protein [Raoultella terrigena]
MGNNQRGMEPSELRLSGLSRKLIHVSSSPICSLHI